MSDFIPEEEPAWLKSPKRHEKCEIRENTRIQTNEMFPEDRTQGCDNGKTHSKSRLLALPVILLLAAIIFLGWKIKGEIDAYNDAETEYADTVSQYVKPSEHSKDIERYISGTKIPLPQYLGEEEKDDPFPDIEIDSEGLLAANKDYRAWFYMNDPEISYPVVQDQGDDYYIHHTFEGQNNGAGCLFIDREANADFTSLNTIIYGHNMYNGTMLGKLKQIYNDPSSFTDPYFYLDVMGTHKTYKIFAVDLVYDTSDLFRIPSADNYDKFVKEVLRYASTYSDPSCDGLSDQRPVVTLSTCYGRAGTDRRLLVFGVLQKSVKAK